MFQFLNYIFIIIEIKYFYFTHARNLSFVFSIFHFPVSCERNHADAPEKKELFLNMIFR